MNSNPALIGSNTALSAPQFDDLYLPVFGGEVLKRYNEYLTASKFIRSKTITSGNVAKFPRMGGMGAERHARGQKLLGLDTEQTQLEIRLDNRPLISHFRLDDIDEAMLYFETRSELAAQAAQALAEKQDELIIRLLINASRSTPASLYGGTNSVFPGGGIDGNGGAYTSADFPSAIVTDPNQAPETWDRDALTAILVALDKIRLRWARLRVPFANRHVILPVAAWEGLAQLGVPKSANDMAGSNALSQPPLFAVTDGTMGKNPNQIGAFGDAHGYDTPLVYRGFQIWASNLAPFGKDLSNDDEAKYRGDFTDTRGIVFQMEAAGRVTLMSVSTEAERDVSRQDWLFLTKMLTGGGTLRAECAVELAYKAE